MPLVSVVVPIYNSAKYLKSCIDSILSQSFKDVEIILVNDGSLDSSGEICTKYESLDNVKYIYQNNSGVSEARQNGVNNSTGEWILFVDSDDVLPLDAVKTMVSISDGVDIVAGATDRDKRHKSLPDYLSSDKYLELLFTEDFGPSPVCKLFRRSLFTDNTIKQFKQFASGEDLLMNLSIAVANKKNVRVCKNKIYYYRPNESSVTHSFLYSYDYCFSYFKAKEEIVESTLPDAKILMLGLRQKIRFFYQTLYSLRFKNDVTTPFVYALRKDMFVFQKYNLIDRYALRCTKPTILILLYYLYRIRIRISRRLYF